MNIRQSTLETFSSLFHASPSFLVRAPGRVNLIGEHTDYNDGFVLPMAIDRAIWIALRPRDDRRVRLHSLDYAETVAFALDDLHKGSGWAEYVKGVAHALQAEGYTLRGWEGTLGGDVPKGAGLSSSAALELAAARAFACVSGFDWHPARMARIGQIAENRWVGVQCGIMDQMACAASQETHALFLDCRSLDYEHVPLPQGGAIVVLDTSTRRGLVASAYNERRAQCEAAAHFFGVPALRDVSIHEFEERGTRKDGLDEVAWKRARHIVSENERVLQAVQAMRQGDMARLGALFDASHVSLRDDFEVSSAALDLIVAAAQAHPACYGARMTGAGFGGCAVALVKREQAAAFGETVLAAYRQKSGLEARVYICQASAGASLVPLP
ncbi:MAG: galactokinase [Anaerolineales bacterium]